MSRTIAILGVPMDLGQGRRGVDMGPSAMRYSRLQEAIAAIGHEVHDLGDVEVPVVESLHLDARHAPGGMVYLETIVQACEETIRRLGELDPEVVPVVLGGDHSIAMGSVAGCSRGERTGLIWVDAHGDFNLPETSPSGNIHGMPLAALCGFGDPRLVNLGWEGAKIRPEDVVVIGARDLDREEGLLLRRHGVMVYTMSEVDRFGLVRIAEEVLRKLANVPRLHVSLDADALDPEVAPGVGTPVQGGLTYREAHLLMELLADSRRVTSLDLVEVNPILDRENHTCRVMVELAASLLGKTIF
ncbi:MAG: arginase [Acidobacteria bacterium]|jgi:arginase|nr:arginase [Thermoanaerobaculia bacterium]MDI9630316.1 arginase [Acidobacteriota bacterium]OQC41247.1 MAG: Arginase [Acidobacteria bacterium ADurb.Bin051]MBP7812554.1 arginase [Thermoanaerobaculia bacterium]MBP8844277.1 arginase [Thermoanaerobaculia bacterium]